MVCIKILIIIDAVDEKFIYVFLFFFYFKISQQQKKCNKHAIPNRHLYLAYGFYES